jgi:radical SAM protein with 4Fe4S-binding SPASM domain
MVIDGHALAQSLEDVALYMGKVNGTGARLEVGPLYHESEHVGEMLSARWGCHAASTNLAFLPTGQITGCSALAMLASTFPELILGDVSGGLNDEAVAHLVHVAQAGGEDRPACQGCQAAANCAGGCLAINYSTCGVPLTPPDFYCQTISMIPRVWHRAWPERMPTATAHETAYG